MNILASAYQTGELIGYGLVLLPLVLGIVKCFRIMRRPQVSKLCVWSLALFLIAMAASCVLAVLREKANFPLPLVVLVWMMCLITMMVSVGLGIAGLVVYSKNKEKLNQGKAQAIWGIVLSGTLLLLAMGNVAVTLLGNTGMAGADDAGESGELPTNNSTTPSAKGGEFVEFDELNFRFLMPSRPWFSIKPSLVNPEASLCLTRRGPQCTFMLLAEKLGVDSDFTTDALVEVARGYLEGAASETEIGENRLETVGDLEFTVFESTARGLSTADDKYQYVHWITSKNGYFFQLITFSTGDRRAAVDEYGREMVERFSLKDPDLVAYSVGGSPVEKFVDDGLGLSIDLADAGWVEWDTIDDDYSEAQFGALSGADLAFGVVAVDLGDADPDIDALTSGMLAAVFGIEFPGNMGPTRAVEQGVASGYEMSTERSDGNGNDHTYRFRVLRAGRMAYLLSAWITYQGEPAADRLARMNDVLDRVEIAEIAPDAEPRDYPERVGKGWAHIANQIGLAYYRRSNFELAQAYFRSAYNVDPSDDDYLGNLAEAAIQRGKGEEILEFFEKQSANFPDDFDVQEYLAQLYRGAERDEDARRIYEQLFSDGCEDEDMLLNFVNLLIDAEKRDLAVEELRKFRKSASNPSVDVDRWEAEVLTQLDRYDDAVGLLQATRKKHPASGSVAYALAQTQIDAGQHTEALTVIEGLLENGHAGVDVYVLKGRAELGLDWHKKAQASFEQASSFDADDEAVKYYLEYTAGALGKGDTTSIKTVIEPVGLPASVVEMDADLQSKAEGKLGDDTGYQSLQRVVGIYHKEGQRYKTTTRSRLRILDAAGINRFSTLSFYFDPLYQALFVNEVVVRDAQGNEVARGKVEDYYVTDDNGDGMANTDKKVNVPVPGLKPGYELSYTVTTENFGEAERFEFDAMAMTRSCPNAGVIVYVQADPEIFRADVAGDVQVTKAEDLTIFHTEQPEFLRFENKQPFIEEFIPYLWLADSRATWEELGTEYLQELKSLLRSDQDLVKELADELTEGLKSDTEKVRALVGHVQDSLSYQAIEFGKRARIPNSPKQTLSNRYGDCKDHSLLLYRLLSEAGIAAHLALVSTNSVVMTELPSLDQFNHMVVHVPGLDGCSFIDCTSKYYPGGMLPAEVTEDAYALVLDAENVMLKKGELISRAQNHIVSERRVSLDPLRPTRVIVTENIEFGGVTGARMRSWLKSNEAGSLKANLAQLLEHYGAPEVQEISPRNLDDIFAPLVVEMTYSLRRFARWSTAGGAEKSKNIRVRMPAVWENYFLREHNSGERRNPFEVADPLRFESSVSFDSGSDWSLLSKLPVGERKVSSDLVEWSAETGTVTDNVVELRQTIQLNDGSSTADKWADYVSEIDDGLAFWEDEIVLRRIAEEQP